MRVSRTTGLLATTLALATTGGAVAALTASAGTTSQRLTVTEVEYKIGLSSSHLKAGLTTFMVVDKGKLAHSLSISGPGLKKRLIVGTIKPGSSRAVTVTLKAGSYSLWCPVPGHAALGMRTTLKAGSSTGSTSGGSTTTKSSWG